MKKTSTFRIRLGLTEDRDIYPWVVLEYNAAGERTGVFKVKGAYITAPLWTVKHQEPNDYEGDKPQYFIETAGVLAIEKDIAKITIDRADTPS